MLSDSSYRLSLARALQLVAGAACLALYCPVRLPDSQIHAQSTTELTTDEPRLGEGLLDLLTEPPAVPAPPGQNASAATKRVEVEAEQNPDRHPSSPTTAADESPGQAVSDLFPGLMSRDDNGLGEDIGAPGRHPLDRHPLVDVQQEMRQAASWLRGQQPAEKTQGLQRDIVARLDQLIGDLQEQTPEPSPATSTSEQPAQARQPQPGKTREPSSKLAGNQQQPSAESATSPPAEPGDADSYAPDRQGPPTAASGQRRDAVVDLNDPRALQRSAWGNLPDRVRDQMQSRMVERFLPSYRDEIEAYYRALVK